VRGVLSHYLIILGACFFFSERAYAGAWNQRAGEGQVISTSYWSNAGQIFNEGDSRFDFEGLDDVELGLQFKTHAREGLSTAIRLSYVIDSRLDNQAVDVLRGGDQYELRALIGQSRETLLGDFFYDAQMAVRTEGFEKVDVLQTALTLGFKPTERWLLMSQSYLNFSNNDKGPRPI